MTQKITMISGSLMLVGILLFSFYGMGKTLASGDSDHSEDSEYRTGEFGKPDPVYVEECGGCHMAYPPQLLPAKSWQKLMQGLEDHFGENAELDNETAQMIEKYLVDISRSSSYKKLRRNLGDKSPLRITELPYFKHEHDEIPPGLIRNNDKISSLSQCNACHRKAERGQFDEDDVYIPGVGRWDD